MGSVDINTKSATKIATRVIKKLALSVTALSATVITLVATTFAWFSGNNLTAAEKFSFNATADNGFLISIDNKNFTQEIKTIDILKSVVANYQPTRYFFKDGQLYDNMLARNLNNQEVETIYKTVIKLMPTTSFDGKDLLSLTETKKSPSSGEYVEFGLYFKSVLPDTELTQEIYLSGEPMIVNDNVVAGRTSIKSLPYDNNEKTSTTVTLTNDMTYIDPITKEVKNKHEGDTLEVYTSNAYRLSIQDRGIVLGEEEVIDNPSTPVTTTTTVPQTSTNTQPALTTTTTVTTTQQTTDNSTTIRKVVKTSNPDGDALIYEISDDSLYDLGSYATSYNLNEDVMPLSVENQLYNCKYNAMYTYYNNVKKSAPINRLEYDRMPTTIRDLSNKDVFTTVKAQEGTKYVMFRMWIEGWDADCFDGLPGYFNEEHKEVETHPISVSLLFKSK